MIYKPFFQLVEKSGLRKGVHSESDMSYMMRFGWKPVVNEIPVEQQEIEVPQFVKRKPGRPRK